MLTNEADNNETRKVQAMTVGTLYKLLDRLPERCDDFVVRFTLFDRTNWIQPDCAEIARSLLVIGVTVGGAVYAAYRLIVTLIDCH